MVSLDRIYSITPTKTPKSLNQDGERPWCFPHHFQVSRPKNNHHFSVAKNTSTDVDPKENRSLWIKEPLDVLGMEEEEGEAQDSTSGRGGFKHQTATMDIRVIKIVNYKTIYIYIQFIFFFAISRLIFAPIPWFLWISLHLVSIKVIYLPWFFVANIWLLLAPPICWWTWTFWLSQWSDIQIIRKNY